LVGLLEKAEMKIKAQNKVIEELNKKKRVGGYGIIQDKPLTLHILKDEEDENDSNHDSNSQPEDYSKSKGKISFRRTSIDRPLRSKPVKSEKEEGEGNFNNLKMLATSLRCIPDQKKVVICDKGKQGKDSLTSEENLLEDVEERVMARTRSQAALMANRHD
jgi:hypothetical protein